MSEPNSTALVPVAPSRLDSSGRTSSGEIARLAAGVDARLAERPASISADQLPRTNVPAQQSDSQAQSVSLAQAYDVDYPSFEKHVESVVRQYASHYGYRLDAEAEELQRLDAEWREAEKQGLDLCESV